MAYNIKKFEHIDIDELEDEEAIESVDCSKYYPGLRIVADKICVDRLHCGLHCRDCKANESNYCISSRYWLDSISNTIKNDMVNYFGEDIVNHYTEKVMDEYGEDIFEEKYKNLDEQVIECYLADNTIRDIAKKFELKETEVYGIIRKHSSKYYNHRDAMILEMFNSGTSIMNISKKFGLSKRRIYRILRLQGVAKTHSIITERNRKIYYDFISGASRKDLANDYGLTEQSVQKIIKSIKQELDKDA